MDSLMDLMQSQINRTINSAINDRVNPGIQNKLGCLLLNRNGREPCTSITEDGFVNAWKNTNVKFTKKYSMSACGLREDKDFTIYMVTGATDSQHPISEFLTGGNHSQPVLQRQESIHDTTMDTILPVAGIVPVKQPQDPISRLADLLVNLQIKPQSMTIRPITTSPMTIDVKTEKCEFF